MWNPLRRSTGGNPRKPDQDQETTVTDPDPHARLHEMAAVPHEDHPAALGSDEAGDSPEEQIAKLDKRLTGRINDLRKDFDATKKAISDSVKKTADDVTALKTSVSNNTASIDAQDASIELAKKAADHAKQAADTAATKADEAGKKADQAAADLHTFQQEYAAHTHPINDHTGPPQQGGAQ